MRLTKDSKFTSEASIYALWYEAVKMIFNYGYDDIVEIQKIRKGTATVKPEDPYRTNYILV